MSLLAAMTMRWLAFVPVVGGCGQVFGLDEVTPPPPIEHRVTGRAVLRVVTNNIQRQPQVTETPSPAVWRVALDDGSEPVVDVAEDGMFTFVRRAPDQQYSLIGTVTGLPYTQISRAADVTIVLSQWGRTGRGSPSAGTGLAYQITPPGTGTARVSTTGLWTSTVGTPSNNFRIEWPNASSMYGPIGLLSAEENDRAYWVFDQDQGGIYTATVGYRNDDVTLVDGQTTTIAAAYTAANRDQCILVNASRADEVARLVDAGYGTAGMFTGSWRLLAVPSPELSPAIGFPTASSSGVTNVVDQSVQAANPYAGHALVLTIAIGRNRMVVAPGATTGRLLSGGTQHFVEPSTTCATATRVTGFAAIPRAFTVGGTLLEADDQIVDIDRTKRVTFGWEIADDRADTYRVDAYQAYVDAGVTTLKLIDRWYTTDQAVTIDPALFEPGSTNIMFVVASTGIPNAASGDFVTTTYPYGYGYTFSTSFTVP